MSNRNRKAKKTTSVDKQLTRAQERIKLLGEQVNAARMSTLNIRQMYEKVQQENQALQRQLDNATQIITGVVLQERNNRLVLKAKTFHLLDEFVGFKTLAEDGNLIVTPVHVKDLEADDE
jgi:hypothetical protein